MDISNSFCKEIENLNRIDRTDLRSEDDADGGCDNGGDPSNEEFTECKNKCLKENECDSYDNNSKKNKCYDFCEEMCLEDNLCEFARLNNLPNLLDDSLKERISNKSATHKNVERLDLSLALLIIFILNLR